jgi:mRNA-degrading endonuclease RelE of RelBE toxin-antitoxin system
MTVRFTERADKDYAALSVNVRKAFGKQLAFLLENPRHPSLRAKKLEGHDELWQARVNRGWRFYFKIEDDEYAIIGIVPHPK